MRERPSFADRIRSVAGAVRRTVSAAAFEFGEATRVWAADAHIDDLNAKLMFEPEGERRAQLLAVRAEALVERGRLQEAAMARQKRGVGREN